MVRLRHLFGMCAFVTALVSATIVLPGCVITQYKRGFTNVIVTFP